VGHQYCILELIPSLKDGWEKKPLKGREKENGAQSVNSDLRKKKEKKFRRRKKSQKKVNSHRGTHRGGENALVKGKSKQGSQGRM